MHINYVELRDFRNYSYEKFTLSSNINILLGNNAQGKTNLLESIYFSCIGKSFKTKNEKELVKNNCKNSRILIDFEKNNGNNKIQIEFKDNQKFVKLNEINITKSSSLLGNLACVFFSPNELKLVKEAPEDRRRFLDVDISQLNKQYYFNLVKYNKILKERNKLLKSSEDLSLIKETLPIWDYQLSSAGAEIILQRLEFIEKLTTLSKIEHFNLSDKKEELKIAYASVDNFENKSQSEIEEILLKKLEENHEKDLKLKPLEVKVNNARLFFQLNLPNLKFLRKCLMNIQFFY